MSSKKKQRSQPPSSAQAPVPAEPSQPEPQPEAIEAEPPADTFPVVGIGASAGGLAAIEAFLRAIAPGTSIDAAFVIVQHLAPEHHSMLPELVQRFTHLPVSQITDGMLIERDHVYVIPPGHDLGVLRGSLQLLEAVAPRGHRLPVDFFFRALAHDMRERAIAVVLSGTGADGSLGVRLIESEGGVVIAQKPESTDYDGMPRSAIASGCVDFVLSPAEMPARIAALHATSQRRPGQPSTPLTPDLRASLAKILMLVRNQTGHDFAQYKEKSILRRIERRMSANQVTDSAGYIRLLQQSPGEVEALLRDLSIGVTSFFRDPEAFRALEQTVLPGLLERAASTDSLRVWVPACSSGEEAYSIAILLLEQIERLDRQLKLQLFATDIDSRAIQRARAGVYPAGALQTVSASRLARYFNIETGGDAYRIKRTVRETILFSEQDLIRDPPFSHVDLISCRNVLIYMNAALQKQLLPTLHFALRPGGVLFLGTSETVSDFPGFAQIDRHAKLYRALSHERPQHPMRGTREPGQPALSARQRNAPPAPISDDEERLRMLAEHTVIEHYAPVAALVNDHGDIAYLHGRTGLYLEPSPGRAHLNILKMAREGLRLELSHLLRAVAVSRSAAQRTDVRVKTNGDYSNVDVTIRPARARATEGGSGEEQLYLILFQESGPRAASPTDAPAVASDPDVTTTGQVDGQVERLKQELRARDDYYQRMTEELESSNEELKSANEEMQSVNEELHSTNEELETSREELQSVNEELATLNIELQAKVSDVTRITNDMNNLMAATGIATIFVNEKLTVQRFTPAVAQVVKLIDSDVGRPLTDIASKLVGYDGLAEDIRTVVRNLTPLEREVQNVDGLWFQLRILPYRTLDNVIDGAVITFVDVTALKLARTALREAQTRNRLAVVVRDAYDAITVVDPGGKTLEWNPSAERLYGWSQEEALRTNLRERIPGEEIAHEMARLKALCSKEAHAPYHTLRLAKDGRRIRVWLTATPLINGDGVVYAIATTEREQAAPDGIDVSLS